MSSNRSLAMMFPDKAKLISLLITSLVIGVLVLANVDRSVQGEAGGPIVNTESVHGWPMVYLHRQAIEFQMANQLADYSWPWPPVENEKRTVSWGNAITNMIVCVSIAAITFMMTNTVLQGFFTPTDNRL